jgi:hypothetical protein
MYMRDWIVKLDDFLTLSGRELLTHAGAIPHEQALAKAQMEYEKHHALLVNQPSPIEAHFEQAIKKLPKPKPGGKKRKRVQQ